MTVEGDLHSSRDMDDDSVIVSNGMKHRRDGGTVRIDVHLGTVAGGSCRAKVGKVCCNERCALLGGEMTPASTSELQFRAPRVLKEF